MSKKITKTAKKTKPVARKATAKLDQRPVILSAPRPKNVLSTSTVRPSKTGTKKDAPKKKSKPKVKTEQRPSAPRPKEPAHEPAAEPQPVTIAPARDSAPAPYYPDYAPKGEERDFAPMVGYFDEATSAQDLRERMLFRRTLGNHPEDVLVAGERKARAMGWNLDAIEVEQPVAASATEPAPETSADAPEELTASTSEPAQPMEAASEQPMEAASDAATIESEHREVPAVEPARPEASAAESAQPAAPEPEPALAAPVSEHQEEATS